MAELTTEKLTAELLFFESVYLRQIESYGELCDAIVARIADGGSLLDVLNIIGDRLNDRDQVDDASIARWEAAKSAVSS